MKKPILLFLSLITIFLLFSCQIFSDPEDITYPKGARLYVEKVYDLNNNTLIGIGQVYYYNDSGKISRVEKPYSDQITGELYSYQEYNYDDESMLQHIAIYHSNINDSSGFINLENRYFHYDDRGNMIREETEYPYAPDQGEYKLNIYQDSVLIRQENHYVYNDEDQFSWYTFTYDEAGSLIKRDYFSADSSLAQSIAYTYQNGLKTKEVVSNRIAQIATVRDFYYDSNRNLIKMVSEELFPYSSVMSFIMKYEYYDE